MSFGHLSISTPFPSLRRCPLILVMHLYNKPNQCTWIRFKFYNKPNGIAHFLKNADPPVSEAVIALVDPDMVFMTTLTPYVGETYDDPSVLLGVEFMIHT